MFGRAFLVRVFCAASKNLYRLRQVVLCLSDESIFKEETQIAFIRVKSIRGSLHDGKVEKLSCQEG